MKNNDILHSSRPKHVAIIMDGNGRWAQARDLNRAKGHRAGVEAIESVVAAGVENGLEFLTLFGFSSENWRRPASEVKGLFELFSESVQQFLPSLQQKNVKLCFIGNLGALPKKLTRYLHDAEIQTAHNTGITVVVALNYGGRWDILQAVEALLKEGKLQQLDEQLFAQYLTTKDIPEPDLLIRTSGETRISNFLLWQLAYTEIYFTDTLWPDFRKPDFEKALAFYATRQRRYGGLNNNE